MEVDIQQQASPVADEVSALIAVIRPCLAAVLQSIPRDALDAYGGDLTLVALRDLGRLRSASDGDVGNAFEYAVHDAVRRREPAVLDKVIRALEICNIRVDDPSSILFAIEKQGSKQLLDTDLGLITEDSRVLSGQRGRPVKLKGQLNNLAAAFRRPTTRPNLPQSIGGLWKACRQRSKTEHFRR